MSIASGRDPVKAPGPSNAQAESSASTNLEAAPFARVIHDIFADERLTSDDVRVAGCLTYWAKSKPDCFVGNKAIAKRAGLSPRSVMRCLKRLEQAEYVRRLDELGKDNKTGRRIVLAWMPGASEFLRQWGVTVESPPSPGGDRGVTPPVTVESPEEEAFNKKRGTDDEIRTQQFQEGEGEPEWPNEDDGPDYPVGEPYLGDLSFLRCVDRDDKADPVDLLRGLGPQSGKPEMWRAADRLAAVMVEAVGDWDCGLSGQFYDRLTDDVAWGRTDVAAVADALALALAPDVADRGRAFADSLDGLQAAEAQQATNAAPEAAKPAPRAKAARKRPKGRREALLFGASVVPFVIKGVRGRKEAGMADELNEAETRRLAEGTCDRHNLKVGDRANYLDWVKTAIEFELNGGPVPSGLNGDVVRPPATAKA